MSSATLKTLAYTSQARLDLTSADLAAILATARHFNALDGITGLLLFDGTRFLQIIEGGEDAIDTLVGHLRADPRHAAFEIRDERPVAARSFPDWSMELVSVTAGGFQAQAGPHLETILSKEIAPSVRALILRMADAAGGTFRMA